MHALLLVVLAMLPQSPATATVEGIVVAHSTGQPIPGAIVELTGIAAPQSATPDWRVRSFSTVTRADGTFAITGVPPGVAYQVVATRTPDFVAAAQGQRDPDDLWIPVSLSAGQRFTGVRIVLHPLSSISGRVVDDEGKPRRNTRVTAVELRYSDSHRIFEDGVSAVTDAAGDFRIGGLRPGRYTIRARPQFHASDLARVLSARGPTEDVGPYIYFPGTLHPNDAVGVPVREGEDIAGLNFTVGAVSLRHVRGLMSFADNNSKPVPNARVFLVPPGAEPESSVTREIVSNNGEFEFKGVFAGDYTVFAVAEDKGNLWTGREVVRVDAKNDVGVKIRLHAGINLEGRMTLDGAKPTGDWDFSRTTVNVAAESRATVDLSLYPGFTTTRGTDPAVPTLRVSPATNGTFSLKGLRSWLYFPSIGIPDAMRGTYVKSIHLGSVDVLSGGQPFDPASGGVLNVVLGADTGTLQGRVLSANGSSMPYATVVLIPDEPRRSRRDLYAVTRADFGGRFNVDAIAAGDYKVFAWRNVDTGAWFFSEFTGPYERRAVSVTVGTAETKTVEVQLLDEPR